MDPARIVLIDARSPTRVACTWDIPAAGPHGLDLDLAGRRLFCACDGKRLLVLAVDTGRVLDEQDISGVPDVVWFNAALQHLYVAIGDPGVIEVFDTRGMRRIETVTTEKGAHTLALDVERNKVYALLPQTHRAAVYVDQA
jgi:DNA-binding beta-propeller fold protein YncE